MLPCLTWYKVNLRVLIQSSQKQQCISYNFFFSLLKLFSCSLLDFFQKNKHMLVGGKNILKKKTPSTIWYDKSYNKFTPLILANFTKKKNCIFSRSTTWNSLNTNRFTDGIFLLIIWGRNYRWKLFRL